AAHVRVRLLVADPEVGERERELADLLPQRLEPLVYGRARRHQQPPGAHARAGLLDDRLDRPRVALHARLGFADQALGRDGLRAVALELVPEIRDALGERLLVELAEREHLARLGLVGVARLARAALEELDC